MTLEQMEKMATVLELHHSCEFKKEAEVLRACAKVVAAASDLPRYWPGLRDALNNFGRIAP